MERKCQYKYLPAPCLPSDIEAMESWLTDMAGNGLLLEGEGGFFGFLRFRKASPQQVHYRLQPACSIRSGSLITNESPNPQQLELCEEYGWHFVRRYKDHFIYLSTQVTPRELDTDPGVQALSIKILRKEARSFLLSVLLAALLFVITYNTRQLQYIIKGNCWSFLILLGIWVIRLIIGSTDFFTLRRLEKQLTSGNPLDHNKDWRKGIPFRYGQMAIRTVLTVCLIASLFFVQDFTAQDIPADKMGTPLPFVTLEELAGTQDYTPELQQMLPDSRAKWEHILSPVNYYWTQNGTAGEGSIDGYLSIDYHEAATPWLAQLLALEYLRGETDWNTKIPEQSAELGLDYALILEDKYGFPTVIMRKGCKIIHAQISFYDAPEAAVMDWVMLMAEKMK